MTNPYLDPSPLPSQAELDDWNERIDRARLEALHHPTTYGWQRKPSRSCAHCVEVHNLTPPTRKP